MKIIRNPYSRTVLYVACLVMILLLSSCRVRHHSRHYYQGNYRLDNTWDWDMRDSINQNLVPWTDKATCLFGFKNKAGNWVIPGQFDNVESFWAGCNRTVVVKNHKFSLIDSAGHLYPGLVYDSILDYPLFDRRKQNKDKTSPYYFVFCKKGRYGLLDSMGYIYLPAKFTEIKWIFGRMMGVEKQVVDTTGKVLLRRAITDHGGFLQGAEAFYRRKFLYVYSDLFDGAYPLSNRSGNRDYSYIQRQYIRGKTHRRKFFKNTWVMGLVDSTGRAILPADYIKIEPVKDLPLFIITDYKDKMGIVYRKGDTLLSPVYFEIRGNFKGINALFYVEKDSLKYLYDYKLRGMRFGGSNCQPDEMIGNTIPVMTNGKYGLAELGGRMITGPQYDDIKKQGYTNEYITKNNGRYGIIDTTGKTIIPCIYRKIYFWDKKVQYIVSDSTHYGMMDTTGKTVLPCSYDKITAMYTGPATNQDWRTRRHDLKNSIIKQGDYYGVTDSNFKIAAPPAYTYLKCSRISADTTWYTAIKEGKVMMLKINGSHLIEKVLTGKGNHFISDKLLTDEYNKNMSAALSQEKNKDNSTFDEQVLAREINTISDYYYNYIENNLSPQIQIENFLSDHIEDDKTSYLVDENGTLIKSFTGYKTHKKYAGGRYYSFTSANGAGIMDSLGNIVFKLKRGYSILNQESYSEAQFLPDSFYYFRKGYTTNNKGVLDNHFKVLLAPRYNAINYKAGAWLVTRYTRFLTFNPRRSKKLRVDYKQESDIMSADGKKTILKNVVPPYSFKDIYIILGHGKYAIADHDGHRLTGFDYEEIKPAPYNHLKIRKWINFGLMDMHGQIILPCNYREIGEWRNGYSVVTGKSSGLIDSNGHFVVKPDTADALFHSSVRYDTLWPPVPAPQDGKIPVNNYDNTSFCGYYTGKQVDSAGIKTALFYFRAGYYQLLKEYPDNKVKTLLNNYMIFTISPTLPIDSIETFKEHTISKDYFYYGYQSRGSEYHVFDFDYNYDYGDAIGKNECSQTELSFQFVSPAIVGVKRLFTYKNRMFTNCKTCDTSTLSKKTYTYFETGRNGIDFLPIEKILKPGAWKDTLINRAKEYIDKITPEAQVCVKLEDKIYADKYLKDKILVSLEKASCEITKDGLVWEFIYPTYVPHGGIIYNRIHLLLTPQDLEPYYIPGNPLVAYYKGMR